MLALVLLHTRQPKALKRHAFSFAVLETRRRTPGDTDAIDLGNGAEVTYCQEFKYLGGTLDTKASDVTEITKRIRSASSIFGMMTKRIFGDKRISRAGKVVQFSSIVLGVLLYGCETWTVTAELRRRLRVFYANCIRVMYGFTRYQQ